MYTETLMPYKSDIKIENQNLKFVKMDAIITKPSVNPK